jgi:hypothetical protein
MNPGLFEKFGSQSQKQSPYAPIFIESWFEGIFSNRNSLVGAGNSVEKLFYNGKNGSILSGLNTEISVRNSIIRRYGTSAFSTFSYPTPPNISFSMQLLTGAIQVLVDTSSTGSLTLSAIGASSGGSAVVTGAFPLGGSNAYAGLLFTITGFTNANNNQTNLVCTASSTTTLTLTVPVATTAETHAGTAQSAGAVYLDNQNGTATMLWGKQNGAGQTAAIFEAGIGYFGDGVQTHMYTPGNTNGTTWGWGLNAPTQQPSVRIVESGSASPSWMSATMFTTMGLVLDTANTAIYQLNSVNYSGTNTTQFGTTSNGQPAWNQSPGATTSDNSVTWTNFGPLTSWTANTTFSNFSVGGTLANPAAIYDPSTGGIFIQSAPGNAAGKSGSIRPTFKASKGFTVQDGGCKWIFIGGTIKTWQKSHAYNKIGTVSFDDSNSVVIEPSGIPSTGLPTNVTLYLQACTTAGTSNSSATSPFSSTTDLAGTIVYGDGGNNWLSLGTYSWAATTPYSAWSAQGAAFSALVDANSNFQIAITTGISATVVPGTSYSITSVSNASGGNTVYHYNSTTAMPSGSSAFPVYAKFSGFAQSANNGTFLVVSSTATSVTVANTSGVSDTTGTAVYNAWAENYGGTTNDGTCTFSCAGSSVGQTWAANTQWNLPVNGFAPPSSSQPLGGASVVDTNANIEFVIQSGLSGGSAPSWSATTGGYTDDNGTNFSLSAVAVSGGIATYTGTGLGSLAGQTVLISGFVNAGNNILIQVLTAGSTTITCTATSQINESASAHAHNGLIWLNEEAFSSNSLAWSFGLCYGVAYKSRATDDFYSTVDPTTNVLPVPPGLANALPAPTGAQDGSISSTGPYYQITGSNAGAVVFLTIQGSLNPAVDTIVIYRSPDQATGNANMLELTEIPNPPPNGNQPGIVVFADYLPATPTADFPGLNVLEPAPIDDVNDPPPATALPMAYNYERIWCANGQQVVFSGGPDTLVGNPNSAFNAADEFPFLGSVVRCVRTPVGLIVFENSEISIIMGGPQTSSFYSVVLVPGVGLGNFNGLDLFAGEIFFFSTNKQLRVLSPNLSLSQPGFPVADQLALFNPSTAYVTFYDGANPDTTAIYVGTGSSTVNGSTGYLRMNPRQAPGLSQPEPCWSPFAAITGGCQMIQSVVTAPGLSQLLIGSTSGGSNINYRNTAVFTDNVNGTPTTYASNAVIGSLLLARRGEECVLRLVETDFAGTNSSGYTVSFLLDEISGSFTPFVTSQSIQDPPLRYGTAFKSTSYSPLRQYFASVPTIARCVHGQFKFDFGNQNDPSELFNFTLVGKIIKGQ